MYRAFRVDPLAGVRDGPIDISIVNEQRSENDFWGLMCTRFYPFYFYVCIWINNGRRILVRSRYEFSYSLSSYTE